MQVTGEALKTAVRALTAINERRNPEESDAEALRRFAPVLGNLKAEDLACEVINQAMKRWPSCANFRARPQDRYLAMPERNAERTPVAILAASATFRTAVGHPTAHAAPERMQ